MPQEDIIVSIDLGTCHTRVVVGQFNYEQEKLQILGIGQSFSQGLRRGAIVDMAEAVKSLKQAIEMASRVSGYALDRAYVGIGECHITSRPSKGVIAVSRADNEISNEDVERAINASSVIALPQNREILHILPQRFIVDDQDSIKDPVGMSGMRLEVNTLLVESFTPSIKNLTKCIQEAGLEIEALILSPLAAAQAVLSKRKKELGVLVLDLGGGTTGLTVFEEGDMIHSQVLPVGGTHITNDIAIGLQTDIDTAEKIKIEYGSVLPHEINKKEIIDLSKLDLGNNYDNETIFSRHYLAEIIEARTEQILGLVNKELKKIDRQGFLPAGVVLVGGGAKMPGLVDLIKKKLRLPVQIGFPAESEGIIEQADDPSFATAIGLILWGINHQGVNRSAINFTSFKALKINKVFQKLGRWLKGLLP